VSDTILFNTRFCRSSGNILRIARAIEELDKSVPTLAINAATRSGGAAPGHRH
jgi:hypothetical protein